MDSQIVAINYWWKKYLAEKLTWQDLELLDTIKAELSEHMIPSGKVFYEEILKQFNERRQSR